jgi:hypothetical protein
MSRNKREGRYCGNREYRYVVGWGVTVYSSSKRHNRTQFACNHMRPVGWV